MSAYFQNVVLLYIINVMRRVNDNIRMFGANATPKKAI